MGKEQLENYNFYHDKLYELVRAVGRLESGLKNIDNKIDKLIKDNSNILENHNSRITALEAKTSEFEGAIKMLKLEVTIVTIILGTIAVISRLHHLNVP